MFIELVNGTLLNVSKIGYVTLHDNVIKYKLIYGEEINEEFSTAEEAAEKYETLKDY